MRTTAPAAEVRTAVLRCAVDGGHAVQATWNFLADVAKALNLEIDENSSAGRERLRVFTGQVRRALGQLADSGDLVKAVDGVRKTWFWPPEAHAEYARAEEHVKAAKAAARTLWERLYDEMYLHGYVSMARRGEPLDLTIEDWMRLLSVLYAAAGS